jgi:putative tryptophan/tyrosine transport system substrate-binding protein
MDRRAFIVGGIAAFATPRAAHPALRTARVGFITPSARLSFVSGDRRAYLESFTGRLRDLGWVEGRNLVIEGRYAEGYYERLPALAAELVQLPVDVIFANSAPAALAAKRATTTLPIVFETLGEPISAGLVSSLARPGANLTGISGLGPELSGKRLELLRELVPGLKRVIVVVNPRNVMTRPTIDETQKAAGLLGLRVDVMEVRDPDQFESALPRIARDGATAVVVVPDPMLLSHARRIQAILLKHRLPGVHAETGWIHTGALMLFGSSLVDHYRQAATFVDKILRGAEPGDLPVEQSTKFELIINLKTAKALGLTIPPSLLARADQVIE